MRLLAVILFILIGSCTGEIRELPVQVERVSRTQTLPEKCNALRKTPDPETWDEVTETYPTNHAWEECMGVERKIPAYVNSGLTANSDSGKVIP